MVVLLLYTIQVTNVVMLVHAANLKIKFLEAYVWLNIVTTVLLHWIKQVLRDWPRWPENLGDQLNTWPLSQVAKKKAYSKPNPPTR